MSRNRARWVSGTAAAAAAAGLLAIGGYARSGTEPAAAAAAKSAAAATPALGASCITTRGAAAQGLTLIATVDQGGAGAAAARARLDTAQRRLQADAAAATDDVLQERLQSISDALHAYVVASGDRTSDEYPEILQTARGLVTGLSRTCLLGDGSFESGTSGWAATGSGAVLARATGGHTGTYAAQVTNTSGGAGPIGISTTASSLSGKGRGSYTAGIWVRSSAGSMSVTLTLQRSSGSTVLETQSATVTADTTWRYVEVTGRPVKTTDTSLMVSATATGVPGGASLLFDDASISRR